MTRPTREGHQIPLLSARMGSPMPNPFADPTDPIDRAAGRDVFVSPSSSAIAPLQTAVAAGFPASAEFGDTPTVGSWLVLGTAIRNAAGGMATPTGWTAHPDGSVANGGMFYKVCDGTETWPIAIGADRSAFTLSEWPAGLTLDDTAETPGTTNPLAGAAGTPTAGSEAVVIGSAVVQTGDFAESVAPDAGWSELADTKVDSGFGPHLWAAYRVVPSAAGSYSPSGTHSTAGADYGAQTIVLSRSSAPVNAGPNATDDDDATYAEASGTLAVAIDLGDPYRIVRGRLFIGTDGAGARTYTLEGANAPDFSDAVTVDTTAFTATGTFTGQEVLFEIAAPDHYRYFRITSDTDEDVRVYSIELYEASIGDLVGVTDHSELDGRAAADQHPADAVSYDNGASGLTATDVQAAIDELATSPGGATSLADLTDVDLYDLIDGDLIAYHAASGTWRPVDPPSGTVPSGADPGDLLIWDGAAWVVLAIGNDGEVLTADAGEALGAKWATASTGSGASRHSPSVPTGDLLRQYTFDSTVESWTASAGTITASSGKARLAHSNNTVGLEPVGAANQADGEVEGLFTIVGGVEASIVFRATDASNFYMMTVTNNGTSTILYQCVAGTFAALRTCEVAQLTGGGPIVLMVRFIGSLIEGYLNGRHMFSVTNATFSTGRIGMRTFNGTLDLDTIRLYENPALLGDNV